MKELLHQLNIILTQKQRRNFALLFLGSVFVAFLDTLAVAMMGPFTTAFTTDAQAMQNNMTGQVITAVLGPQSTKDMVIIMSLLLIAIYLVRGIVKVAYNLAQAMVVARARTELSHRLFDFVMHQPYQYHTKHNTSETQRLVSGDVSNCFNAIDSIMMTVSSGMVGMGILLLLLKLNWILTLAMAAWLVVIVAGIKMVLRARIKKAADVLFKANADMNKWVIQAIGNLKMCLVKNTQDHYIQNYFSSAKKAANVQAYYTAVDGVPKVLIDTCCMVLLFGVVLVEALTGQDIAAEISTFVVYAIAALRLIPMVNQIAATINAIGFMRPSINIVCDVLESGELQTVERTRTRQKEDACAELKTHEELREGIGIEHISFKFDDSEEYLFKDVDIRIPARRSVAFVGPTGAGKTTLADIILGLQPPEAGRITADGYDVRENPQWWAKMVGYIPQAIYLLDSSVRENIAVGDAAEKIDDDWIWECLDRAQMKEFVQSLPQGLDTNIGENGIRFSGGQRQRIGIARALYSRPQFLLMDEATSALDNETEKAIVESINELSGDITMLIIAHRLTTIEDCDIIYRVDNGKVTLEKRNLH